ncbi:class III extradiol dioxygenase subunit B-like domain-containing protein [Actinomadura sp. 21ATH]|uniref:class III extradiol dioxygenase subunit B-like domain-containing protein n=1 Tax=Actinomadura sp. 21ATH TaxID=1735444 RepID=UPI0035C13DF9
MNVARSMLVSAAVCPHPPLLVPAVAGAAAAELDALREACRTAVGRLRSAVEANEGCVLYVVGGDTVTRAYGPGVTGSLHPYGLGERPERDATVLPLSLTIGEWLLRDSGLDARFQGVAYDASPEECARLGRELAGSAGRVALLVMGDGSACLTEKAPGYLHPAAEAYDAAVAGALKQADAPALAGLDPEVSRDVQAAGRAAWQVLAGAAVTAPASARYRSELLAYEAPYGVGYFVASWEREGVT